MRVAFSVATMLIFASSFASAWDNNEVGYELTTARLSAIVPVVIGLISVVIGGLSLFGSSGGPAKRRMKTIVALVMGLVCMVLAGLHLANATGDFGTGGGKAGAIVALGLGVAGMALGGIALLPFVKTK